MIPFMYAIREIRRRKYRTAMNIAGFVIAISVLIALVMAARGWETCTAVPLNSIGTDIIFIYTAPILTLVTAAAISRRFGFHGDPTIGVGLEGSVEGSITVTPSLSFM